MHHIRADKKMNQDGEEGFAEQLVAEAGAEKILTHPKQPLILLWNRYQASANF